MTRTYLKLSWICGLIALATSFLLPPIDGIYLSARIVLVAIMFFLTLYLSFAAGSKVREAEALVTAAGEDEVPKEAVAAFEEFRGIASQLNGAILLLGLMVVFITAFYG